MLKKMLTEVKWNKTVINEEIINNYITNGEMMSFGMGFEEEESIIKEEDDEQLLEED